MNAEIDARKAGQNHIEAQCERKPPTPVNSPEKQRNGHRCGGVARNRTEPSPRVDPPREGIADHIDPFVERHPVPQHKRAGRAKLGHISFEEICPLVGQRNCHCGQCHHHKHLAPSQLVPQKPDNACKKRHPGPGLGYHPP